VLGEALKGKEKSADAGVEASRTALKVLTKAQTSGSRKTTQKTTELADVGNELAAMLGAINNGTGYDEVREKLADAKTAFTRAIKDQADQNTELADARKAFMEQLDSYIEAREKQSELSTTEVSVNVEMSNRLKRQLAEQIKANKDKHAAMDKKKAEEMEHAKGMRARALQERKQAKTVLQKAGWEAADAKKAKDLALAEAADLKKQSSQEAAAMIADARKEVEVQKKKAEQIAEQAQKEADQLKKETAAHNEQLVRRVEENSKEMEDAAKQNMEEQQGLANETMVVGEAAAIDFKTNLLAKAKSASEALIEKAQATAATKQIEMEVKYLEQNMEQQRQRMETKLAQATSKESALELRQSLQPGIDDLEVQLKGTKETLVGQQKVLEQASKVAQAKLIDASICSYSTEQASKTASQETCLSECRTIKDADGAVGERLGCDNKSCSFICAK